MSKRRSVPWTRQPQVAVQPAALSARALFAYSGGDRPTPHGRGIASARPISGIEVRRPPSGSSVIVVVYYPTPPAWNSGSKLYSDTSADWPNDSGISITSPRVYGFFAAQARDTGQVMRGWGDDLLPGNIQPGGLYVIYAEISNSGIARTAGSVDGRWLGYSSPTDLSAYQFGAPAIGAVRVGSSDTSSDGSIVLAVGRYDGCLLAEEVRAICERPWAGLFSPLSRKRRRTSLAIPPGLILGPDGRYIHSSAPSASDRRVFLAADGSRIAATSQPTGSRPLSLSGGGWHAGSAS